MVQTAIFFFCSMFVEALVPVCERVFALLNYLGSKGNYALEMLLYYVMLSNQKSELY